MGPLVFELVEHVDVAKGTQDPAHETRFTYCALNGVETAAYDALCANDAGDGAGDFAEDVVGACDGFFAGGDGVGDLLRCFEARVNDRNGDHPDTMLHAWR